MSAKSPSIGKRRWQRPNIYRAILIVYLVAMSIGAGVFLSQHLWYFTRPDIIIDSVGPPPVNYILPLVASIATSALASFLLATNMRGQFTRAILYIVVLLWTLVTFIFVFAEVVTYSVADMRQILKITYLVPNFVLLAVAAVSNGLMYVLLGKLYSNKSKSIVQ
ncbi:MAG: hypothetical protein ACREBU_02495 [Nitrososphaera sp.]